MLDISRAHCYNSSCSQALRKKNMERWLSWSKAHDWKSCRAPKALKGSNPFLSAISPWQKRCHGLFCLLYRAKVAKSTSHFWSAFYRDVQPFQDGWTFLLDGFFRGALPCRPVLQFFRSISQLFSAVFRMFSISPQPISHWLRGFFVFPDSFQFVFKFSILYLL